VKRAWVLFIICLSLAVSIYPMCDGSEGSGDPVGAALRSPTQPRANGALQCSRCGCRTAVTVTTGAVIRNGRKTGGTVICKDVCDECRKRGIESPMVPSLGSEGSLPKGGSLKACRGWKASIPNQRAEAQRKLDMWKLKLDDKGAVVMQNGKPVYINPEGKEVEFDVEQVMGSVAGLRAEAKTHREAKEAAEAAIKVFTDAGLDPKKAADYAKALQTVANLDQGKLVEAGKVEEIRQAAIATVKKEFEPVVAERDTLKSHLVNEKIGGAFARSPLIVGEKAKLAIPADLVQARFGSHFALDPATGKVTAKDANGNVIYSRANPGVAADFDEALDIIVDQYPQKASILKGSGSSGSGSGAAATTPATGGKVWTRAQFDGATQMDRMAFSKAGGKIDG
jgi:hypothetical protein